MLDRTLASALSQGQDGPVTIGGWVETLRDQKRIQFIKSFAMSPVASR